MDFNKYQATTKKTRLPTATVGYVAMGLLGEAGEIASLHAKFIRDGNVNFAKDLEGELGDLLWFISEMASDNGLSLDRIAKNNLIKLTTRKKNGTLKGSGDRR